MWTRLLTLVNPLGVGHMTMWAMGVNHIQMWIFVLNNMVMWTRLLKEICPRGNNKVITYISLYDDKCLLSMLELY